MHVVYYRHLLFANFKRQGGDCRIFYFSCGVMATTEWITRTRRVKSGTEIEHFVSDILGVISNIATVRNSDVISDSVKIYSICI